tara:strand:- start:117 stop:797 length:681 start_codon:yes stop_codon:yes gene_type:complete
MKVVALLPFWSNYQPSPNVLNCIPLVNLGGKTLISRTIELVNQTKLVDEVIVFASDEKVMNYIDENAQYNFVKRDISLDSVETSIEDIVESFLSKSNADIVLLIHPKSPFLKPQTISNCINQVVLFSSDSSFTATPIRSHLWFKDGPLNHTTERKIPSFSKIDPLLIGPSSVYVFTRKLFEETRRMVGNNPFIEKIGHFESFEIEREDDYAMAELIINAGLDIERI